MTFLLILRERVREIVRQTDRMININWLPLVHVLSPKLLQCLGPCSYQLSHTGHNSTDIFLGHIIIHKNSECAIFCILSWRISVSIFLLKALIHYDTPSELFIIDLSQVFNYYNFVQHISLHKICSVVTF